LADRAEGVVESHPLLGIANFTRFLWNYLQLRPTRRRIPLRPVREFIAFARDSQTGLCDVAITTGELALAVALLQRAALAPQPQRGLLMNRTSTAMRLTQQAELRMRNWWREFVLAMEDLRPDLEDFESWTIDVLLHVLVTWPILELLQALQNLIFGDKHVVGPSVGTLMDRFPAAHVAELEKKGPDFWQERRRLLRAAVYGGAEGWLDGPSGPPKPFKRAHEWGGTVITWDLGGKMNATALVTRSTLHRARGLVILHNGHDARVSNLEERSDPYGLATFIMALGFDVITLCMPYTGFNHLGEDNPYHEHDEFAFIYGNGDRATLAYFLAPVRLALDWAESELGHRRFAMVGFSGGGWTTYLAAALEPRISLSIAAVGTLPPHLVDAYDWIRYDYELRYEPEEAYADCPMLCWFVLATVEGAGMGPRWGVHLFHLQEDHPFPTANTVLGMEAEMEDYYGSLLPRLAASAAGRPLADVVRRKAPLRLAVTASKFQHIGTWRDQALLEVLLQRWASLPSGPGSPVPADGPFPAEWPMPVDVRHASASWVNGAAAAA